MMSRAIDPRTLSSLAGNVEKSASSEELASLLPATVDYDQKEITIGHQSNRHYDDDDTSRESMKSNKYAIQAQDTHPEAQYATPAIDGIHTETDSSSNIQTLKSLMIPRIIISLVNYAFLAFLDTSFTVLQPLMYSTSIESGGLGFSSRTIGLILAAWGVLNVIVQGMCFPWFHDRFGTRTLYIFGIVCFLGCFTTFPIMAFLTQRAGGVDPLTSVVLIIQLGLYFLPCMAYSMLLCSSLR